MGLVLLGILAGAGWPAAAMGASDYILAPNGRRVPVAKTYTLDRVQIFFGKEVGPLASPSHMVIDREDNIYLADSGNNRVLKFNADWEIQLVITEADGRPLRNPQGLYVDEYGYIFIADTDNNRIVNIAPTGEYVESFVKPESALYDSRYAFRPMRLSIDPVGQIYMINLEDYHGFVILDAENNFRGYVAPTRLPYSFLDKLIEYFATPEQKERLAKRMPPIHSSLSICERGTIYSTTRRTGIDQLKRFSNIGVNIFPKQGSSFGETRGDYVLRRFGVEVLEPDFVDLAVDPMGVISLLDRTTGKVYQYDNDGMLLGVFAGKGTWGGKFISPVSIAQDSRGALHVLDSHSGAIHVFQPTAFIRKVHDALALYYAGKYEEAVGPWQEILAIDPNYSVAHIGMGKAYMKQERWQEAMDAYKAADDRTGYSAAFREIRKAFFRQYFGLLLLLAMVLLAGAARGFVLLRKAQRSQGT